MIRSALFAAPLLLLSACTAPLEIYYKPGASVSRMLTDTNTCDVSALQDAPVANQVRQYPGYYVPGYRSCNKAGRCTVYSGYWAPGRIYTVDVNAQLRQRLTDQCMAAKGYQRTEIPACPQSVADRAAPAATRTLPSLSTESCAIRYESGAWQIVNAP